ncbi:MAG: hypothetical protein Q8J78_10935 [Moraxellaceae bacterium]|nr:hypothetical protein [Moraxellaceae bacterium]
MSQRYRLVFRGKYLPGMPPEEVWSALADLFKVPEARVQTLLASVPAVIKHDVDIEQGNRYMEAIAEAGLITHLEPMQEGGKDPLPAGAWDGIDRRSGRDRRIEADRRASLRGTAIQPSRRRSPGRRKTDFE